MPKGQFLVLGWLVLFISASGGLHAEDKDTPTEAQLVRAIAELGSDTYETRQKAQAHLQRWSSLAAPLIRSTHQTTDDPEVRKRTGELIRNFVQPEEELLEALALLNSYEDSKQMQGIDRTWRQLDQLKTRARMLKNLEDWVGLTEVPLPVSSESGKPLGKAQRVEIVEQAKEAAKFASERDKYLAMHSLDEHFKSKVRQRIAVLIEEARLSAREAVVAHDQ